MNELMVPENGLAMSSKEIAELTGKQHKHVIRDIKAMLVQIYKLKDDSIQDGPKMDHVEIKGVLIERDERAYIAMIHLDKDHTLTLLTGYDAGARLKVVRRWQDLEAANARPLSLAQIALVNAQALVKLEEEQRQLTLRQEATERRLDQIETATDHFTIIGWWRYAKQSGSLAITEAAKLGRQATLYCKDHEVPMGEVPDPRFGVVKTYPKWVLDDLFSAAH